MNKQVIKVMADYQCFPTWVKSNDIFENVNPRTLPLHTKTADQLMEWSREYDLTLNIDDPLSSPGFSSFAMKSKFVDIGLKLAKDIARQLGDQWEVVYFDEETNAVSKVG